MTAAAAEDTTTKALRSPQCGRRRTRTTKGATTPHAAHSAPVESPRGNTAAEGSTGRDAALAAIVRFYSVGFELDRLHTEACSGKRGTAWHQQDEIGRMLAEFDEAQDAAMEALGFTIDEVVSAYLDQQQKAA